MVHVTKLCKQTHFSYTLPLSNYRNLFCYISFSPYWACISTKRVKRCTNLSKSTKQRILVCKCSKVYISISLSYSYSSVNSSLSTSFDTVVVPRLKVTASCVAKRESSLNFLIFIEVNDCKKQIHGKLCITDCSHIYFYLIKTLDGTFHCASYMEILFTRFKC